LCVAHDDIESAQRTIMFAGFVVAAML